MLNTVHRFDAASPGVVFAKTTCDSPEERFELLVDRGTMLPSATPVAIKPPGLTYDRRRYLHANIRPFVKDLYKDVLCPCPPEREDAPAAGPSAAPVAGPSTAPDAIASTHRGGVRGRGRRSRQPSPTQTSRKRTRGDAHRGHGSVGRGRGGAGRGRGGAGRGRGGAGRGRGGASV